MDSETAHVVVQKLTFEKDNSIANSNVTVANDADTLSETISLSETPDGLYNYAKLVLPTQDHEFSGLEKLYYDTTDDCVYYEDEDNPDNNLVFTDVIESFNDIFNIITSGRIDNCFYFDDNIFTMYYLVECFALTEKELLDNYLKNNCQGGCDGYTNLEYRTTLLLTAINVLKYLLEKQDLYEAQRVLSRLDTCGGLCKNYKHLTKGCGCGRT